MSKNGQRVLDKVKHMFYTITGCEFRDLTS